MGGRLAFFGIALAVLLAGEAQAQLIPAAPAAGGIAVVTQDRLVEDSAMGKALQSRFEAASRILVAENRKIEAALEEEERSLTARRASMPPAEFHTLATDFDKRVEQIRAAQDAKSRALTRQRDEDRQRVLERAVPVMAKIMEERGASVLLDRSAIVLSFDRIDITDEVIARLDALHAESREGEAPAPATPAGPVPEPAAP